MHELKIKQHSHLNLTLGFHQQQFTMSNMYTAWWTTLKAMNQQLFYKAIENNLTRVKLILEVGLLAFTQVKLHVQKVDRGTAVVIYLAISSVCPGVTSSEKIESSGRP